MSVGRLRQARQQTAAAVRTAAARDTVFVAALLLAILAPLLFGPGYILLHDWAWTPDGMAFSPQRRFPAAELWGSGIYPLNWVPLQLALDAIAWLLPQTVVQRLLLVGIFALLAFGARALSPLPGRASRLYMTSLAVVNPWVLDRLLIGQWFALAGMAVLPFALLALFRALRGDGVRPLLLAAAAWALMGVADSHAFYLFIPVPLIAAAAFTASEPARWRAFVLRTALLFVLVAPLAAYWVVPALRETPTAALAITVEDLEVFATRPDETLGLEFNTAAMRGFWYAGTWSTMSVPAWWALFLVIAALGIAGALEAVRFPEHRAPAITMVLLGVVAWLAAMGAGGPSGSLYSWALEHVPGMWGLREAQRAAFFLPLVYGYLGSFAVARFVGARIGPPGLDRLARLGVLLLVVLVYSFGLFWGGLGTVTPRQYPRSWAETREMVAGRGDSALLVLPWQRFMQLSFTGLQNIVSPAPRYFGGTVFAGDNDRLPLASAVPADARFRYIERLLDHRYELTSFGNLLSVVGVRYIFVTDGPGFQEDVAFLERQRDLRLVRGWDDAALYENLRPASLFYAAAATRRIDGIGDLIRLSANTALTDYVWIPTGGPDPDERSGGARALRVRQTGPGAFEIEGPGGAYLQTAAMEPSPEWTLDGSPPLDTITPVLAYPGATGALANPGPRSLLVTYRTSAAAWALLLGGLVAGIRPASRRGVRGSEGAGGGQRAPS